MGTFRVTIQVGDIGGARYESLDALVDTGASHLVVPRPVLERLGTTAEERWPFELADNRVQEYDVGQVRLRVDGRESFTSVVFGDPGGPALLGATALELFNLGVDPVRQRLVPLRGLLMALPGRDGLDVVGRAGRELGAVYPAME
jgi:clan AA aspartic protease